MGFTATVRFGSLQACQYTSLERLLLSAYRPLGGRSFKSVSLSVCFHLKQPLNGYLASDCFRPEADITPYFEGWLDKGLHTAAAVT